MVEKDAGKALTKDRLVGMKVIDGQGYIVGEVNDIAFKVGTTPMSLVVILKTIKGEEKRVSWEEVQAAGDYVILKPETATPNSSTNATICSNCGGLLTFIQQYQRWYCMKCKKYS